MLGKGSCSPVRCRAAGFFALKGDQGDEQNRQVDQKLLK